MKSTGLIIELDDTTHQMKRLTLGDKLSMKESRKRNTKRNSKTKNNLNQFSRRSKSENNKTTREQFSQKVDITIGNLESYSQKKETEGDKHEESGVKRRNMDQEDMGNI